MKPPTRSLYDFFRSAFSSSIDPDNDAIQKLKNYADKNDMTTGKFTIGDEKKHNVRFPRPHHCTFFRLESMLNETKRPRCS
jgi:hypothetical protein